MQYTTSFEVIKRGLHLVAAEGTVRVNISYDELLAVLRQLLLTTKVDEAWYQQAYPDVAKAIAAGIRRSAKEHFVQHGYFEGRLPYEIPVDEAWYLRTYPDVAKAVERGEHRSAVDHFLRSGYREGRLPSPPLDAPSGPVPEAATGMTAATSETDASSDASAEGGRRRMNQYRHEAATGATRMLSPGARDG